LRLTKAPPYPARNPVGHYSINIALLVVKQVESVIVMQSAFTLGTAIVGALPAFISIVQRPLA
jgi:hypothetical protein